MDDFEKELQEITQSVGPMAQHGFSLANWSFLNHFFRVSQVWHIPKLIQTIQFVFLVFFSPQFEVLPKKT
jgi:hypothetical protein